VTEVQRATQADVPQLAGVLARAFFDDPVFAWLLPDGPRRLARAERIFGIRLRHLVTQDETWTTDDLAGAAMWAQPDEWRVGLPETLQLFGQALPHTRLRSLTVARGLHNVEKQHPAEPQHYYLAVLGTDPSRQGEGIGTRLMTPVLERCDADGVGAYLESSKERNIGYYTRYGFKVTAEIQLPDGPKTWPMWRDPR